MNRIFNTRRSATFPDGRSSLASPTGFRVFQNSLSMDLDVGFPDHCVPHLPDDFPIAMTGGRLNPDPGQQTLAYRSGYRSSRFIRGETKYRPPKVDRQDPGFHKGADGLLRVEVLSCSDSLVISKRVISSKEYKEVM
jgi:hypothetical protein